MAKSWKARQRNQQARQNYVQEFVPQENEAIYQYDPYALDHREPTTSGYEIMMPLWRRRFVSPTARQQADKFRQNIETAMNQSGNLERIYRELQPTTKRKTSHAEERHELQSDVTNLNQILTYMKFANGGFTSHSQHLACIFSALLKPESESQQWSVLDSIYDWLNHVNEYDTIRLSVAISDDDLPNCYANESTKMTSLSAIRKPNQRQRAGIAELQTNSITIVIQKQSRKQHGFIIKTDYPDCDERTAYVLNKTIKLTERNLLPILRQTNAYKTASPEKQQQLEAQVDFTQFRTSSYPFNQSIEQRLDKTRIERAKIDDLKRELFPPDSLKRKPEKGSAYEP